MAYLCKKGVSKMMTLARDGRFPPISKFIQPLLPPVCYQTTMPQPQVKSSAEIPGPRTIPIVGSVFSRKLYKEFDKKALHLFWKNIMAEYGPIIRLSVPGMPNLIAITNPDDCETVIRSTMDSPIRPPLDSLKLVRLKAVDDYFEQKTGLITENGEEWKRVRSRVQTPMMKPKNVNAYLPEMDEVTLDFMDRCWNFFFYFSSRFKMNA